MKDVSSEVNVKAMVSAIVLYAIGMGLVGDYWALQCGSHWFTYCVLSFLPYAVPAVVVVYLATLWYLSRYDFGEMRFWLMAAGLSVVFFAGCFVFAHLQPAMQLFSGTDCEPF